MALLVQKFGGTSLADSRGRKHLLAQVQQVRDRGDLLVLVVSAMGRRGAPYATDTLLEVLRDFDPKPEPMISDLLVSCGEVISACVIATLLRREGIQAWPLTAYTAGITARGPFGDASPTGVDARAILDQLGTGSVPVITGFQAVDPDNRIITLGRGGSDTSAVAIGAALKADFVDIFTDVPGVAKADPRVIDRAEFMDFLDYRSMFRLASYGAKVLHDRSAKLAEQSGILVRVRSTFSNEPGTLIGPEGYVAGKGKPKTTTDFIGLAAQLNRDDKRTVTAVFAKGKGKAGIPVALRAARRVRAECNPLDDPDAVAFRCGREEFPALAKVLYEALVPDRFN